MADSAITIDHLQKSYRGGFRRPSIDALRGVSFQVGRGEIFGLLGPNGAGKTTVIKILLGIIRASGGAARLLGFSAGDRRGRQRVGYLPENLQFPRYQTARTALEYYGQLSGLSLAEIQGKREALLATVGLQGRDRESVKRYSKGMLQRLGLAQALLHDPEVLILDEPTDGLDPVGRSHVRNILAQLRDEGRTVFLNSHLLQEVELVCDRVAILDRGTLRFEGTIGDLTPTHQTTVILHLAATEEAARSALGSHAIEQLRVVATGLVQAILPLQDQQEVDAVVDQVRQAGISIRAMNWRRKTLEDAFLELVSIKAEPA